MFTFQAIHNRWLHRSDASSDVKELLSMFTFQAIHNEMQVQLAAGLMSKNYCQCLLFKQFTTLW